MNKKPLISVIVPIYNVEKYLNRCIESIIGQTYKNLEVILVDDGSTDGCARICDDYAQLDSRIKVIHKTNGGLSNARNVGLSTCTGEYIGFVDSDDYIDENMYNNLFEILATSSQKIACSVVAIENEDGCIVAYQNLNYKFLGKNEYIQSLLLHKGDVSVCSKLFPANLIGTLRFDESKLNEDLLFMVNMSPKIKGIIFSEDVGYHYLMHRNSISGKFGKSMHDMVNNAAVVRCYIINSLPELSSEAERFEIYQNLVFLQNCLIYGDKNDILYRQVITFLRKNMWTGIKNIFLTKKNKIMMVAMCLVPRLVALLLCFRIKVMRNAK